MGDKNNLPKGWGETDDDEEYYDLTDEESETDSPFAQTDENNESEDISEQAYVHTEKDECSIFKQAESDNVIYTHSKSKKKFFYFVILILVLIIVILLLVIVLKESDKKSSGNQKNNSSFVEYETTEISDKNNVTTTSTENFSTVTEYLTEATSQITETTTITEAYEAPTENQITAPITQTSNTIGDFTGYTATNQKQLNQAYYTILSQNSDFIGVNSGSITDLNKDGLNEIIITDTDTMDFVYYFSENGNIYSRHFGGFLSLSSFKHFTVNNPNGDDYIYHRSEYSYKSYQGYFDRNKDTGVTAYIDYVPSAIGYTADCSVSRYNSLNVEQLYRESEEVADLYGGTPICYPNLLSILSQNGFNIYDSSSYTKIESMSADELKNTLYSSAY